MCRFSTLALLLLLALSACGLDTVDVNASRRAIIRGAPDGTAGVAVLATDGLASFDVAGARELESQGAGPEDIDSVKLASLIVTVEAPSGAALDFIDHVDFFVSSPGLPTLRVGSMSVAGGAIRAKAHVRDVELRDHLTADSMTFFSRVAGRQPSDDTTIRVDAVLRVNVAIGPF